MHNVSLSGMRTNEPMMGLVARGYDETPVHAAVIGHSPKVLSILICSFIELRKPTHGHNQLKS